MSSQELPEPLPKRFKLPFFPSSFPDETLYSRVSRYHLLSGERKDENTFLELFGLPGPKVDFAAAAPASLERLASLLPGDQLVQLGYMLSQNTFLPLLKTKSREYEGEEFGEARSCLICLHEDEHSFGSAYLHRSHQLPGVTACWKHGVKLTDACPNCNSSFKRPGKLLRPPLTPCGCGNLLVPAPPLAAVAAEGEQIFAKQAHTVLNVRTRQTSIAVLVRFFQRQIETGFYRTGVATSRTINRSVLLGMIRKQLREGRSASDVAQTAAAVLASAKKSVWWYGDILSCSDNSLKETEVFNQLRVFRG